MLVTHAKFLANANLDAARELLAAFRKVSGSIAEGPMKYPYADNLDAADIPREMYRKCLFCHRYKALFLVEGRTVYIDAIIDCRQENKNLY
jgi:hypothetical protein